MTMAHRSGAGSVSGSLSPCWSIWSAASLLPHTRPSARGAAVQRLRGAPEGQPSVTCTRKSAQHWAEQGWLSEHGPGAAGQEQDRAQGGLSCVCRRWKGCHLFVLGRTLLLQPPQRAPGAGMAALEALAGGKSSQGYCSDHRVTHRAGTCTCKVLSCSRG